MSVGGELALGPSAESTSLWGSRASPERMIGTELRQNHPKVDGCRQGIYSERIDQSIGQQEEQSIHYKAKETQGKEGQGKGQDPQEGTDERIHKPKNQCRKQGTPGTIDLYTGEEPGDSIDRHSVQYQAENKTSNHWTC